MRTRSKTTVKNSVGRMMIVGLLFIVQIAWIVALSLWLNDYSVTIYFICGIAALLLSLRIYGARQLSSFKMPWIILILTFPLPGVCLYFLFGHKGVTKKMRKRFEKIDSGLFPEIAQDKNVLSELESKDFTAANQCRYIYDYGKYPVYKNSGAVFYSEAADGFEAQLEALKNARSFIFMEYHAIEEANSFSRLKAVLEERAKSGVEVRILYDDVGSVGFIDPGFIKRMEEIGVQCRVFNPVNPIINLFMNNRDHRKITVIDGEAGFTGGYNLADEYFNIVNPYGYWKDTGVKLIGAAVKSLTVMFLEMWNAMGETDKTYEKYLKDCSDCPASDGYIQLYADSPLDNEPMGENVYLNLIKSAKHRLYIATPYLIITDEMERELCLAAKRGVDVRVITPGIPDKKLIFKITRSYYYGLVRDGVKVYEYTPGFLHAKQVLCDDYSAVVGTINFDYRSLYHHFENAVLMHGCSAVNDIADDFLKMLEASGEVTGQYREKKKSVLRISQCILRLFAPLL